MYRILFHGKRTIELAFYTNRTEWYLAVKHGQNYFKIFFFLQQQNLLTYSKLIYYVKKNYFSKNLGEYSMVAGYYIR